MRGRVRKAKLIRTLTIAAVLALAACSGTEPVTKPAGTLAGSLDASRRGCLVACYSIEALTQAADAVLIGTAGDVTQHFTDNGGDAANPPIPGVFQTFKVTRAVYVRGEAPAEVQLILAGSTMARSEGQTPLEPGANALIFVKNVSGPLNGRQRRGSITISGDSGVFDLVGQEARPRSPLIRALSESDTRADMAILVNAPLRSSDLNLSEQPRETALAQVPHKLVFNLGDVEDTVRRVGAAKL